MNKLLLITFVLVVTNALGTINALAGQPCNAIDSQVMINSGCKVQKTGLSGLFRSQNQPVALNQENLTRNDVGFFLPYSNVVDGVRNGTAAQRSSTKLKSSREAMQYEEASYAPHELPVFGGKPDLLIYRSQNKQLSKGAHDGEAILMMRCRSGTLNILLDFPGYPMSNASQGSSIAYKLENGMRKTAEFATSNQLSVIGIWQPEKAKQFARDVFRSKGLQVSTKDTENNAINAKFELSDQNTKAIAFRQACGIG